MLSKKEFADMAIEEIIRNLKERGIENVTASVTTVVKQNDQKLTGITLKSKEENAAPTLYVDDLYESYKDGADVKDIASGMTDRFLETKNMPKPPEVDLSYESVKDRLSVRLIETKRNKEFLSNMPYANAGCGLALISDINMGEDRGGDWRIAVNNHVLEMLGTDKETLLTDSVRNSIIIDPPVLTDMSQAIFSQERENRLDRNEPVDPSDVSNMYVLTNTTGSFGAAALFSPDVKEKAAELIGGGYYVLPSSVHETILVPFSAGVSEKELCDMVKQANRTVVEEKDVLSDNVYRYDPGSRSLSRVEPDKERRTAMTEGR